MSIVVELKKVSELPDFEGFAIFAKVALPLSCFRNKRTEGDRFYLTPLQ
jgi:hypothetical protein